MSSKDQVQRFMFDQLAARGQLVGLHDSYIETISNHDYPEPVKKLLGEFMAAATLLSTTLKFNGTLSLQAIGKGDLSLIMAECRHNQDVRAIARWEGESCPEEIMSLLGDARLAITISPDKGQKYQGIITLEGDNLASCLETYFRQSEQLLTRVWLTAQPQVSASGLLIQVLPTAQGATEDPDGWNRICQLSDTLEMDELQTLGNEEILHRLYHEEAVRVFPATDVRFKCTCSAYRTLQAIVTMGGTEIEDIFSEQPQITVRCEFCNTGYEINQADVELHLKNHTDPDTPHTLH